jgi:N-acyl-D-amino-acid deacylase
MSYPLGNTRVFEIDRRRVLQATAGAVGVAAALPRALAAHQEASPLAGGAVPVTGESVPELAAFDEIVLGMMEQFELPGGQLAIAREGRLVFNRGFGYASVEDQEPVEPDALFRIASNSKPITAVAILKLVDAGELTLDTPVFPLLGLEGPANAPCDPRLDTITVEQLLVHSGGWNSAATLDPQYLPWPLLASHVLGAEVPAEAATIVRYMVSQPLDFDPGTASAYSNFGFNVLGRVIEHLTGKTYEQYVIDELLAPNGVERMAIGGTTLAERADGEVQYYSIGGLAPRASVYPGEGFVPVGYGSFYTPSLDSHGGWIASAADLLRFTLAVDGTRGDALLTPETVSKMESSQRPPAAAAGAGNVEEALGLGWNCVPVDGGGYTWSHAGALEGSNCSWLTKRADGSTVAFVFNALPVDFGAFFGTIIPAFEELLGSEISWPETDLFG